MVSKALFMKFVQSHQVKDLFGLGYIKYEVFFVQEMYFPMKIVFVISNITVCFIWKHIPIAVMKEQIMGLNIVPLLSYPRTGWIKP
jgi:hypothetical protein